MIPSEAILRGSARIAVGGHVGVLLVGVGCPGAPASRRRWPALGCVGLGCVVQVLRRKAVYGVCNPSRGVAG